jgi:ubiquinone/menaquinone biosynthesis C-methylase UbiE
MDDWIDYYDSTHTIYASRLHRDLHFQLIARDIIGYISAPDAVVLDYACGEALSATKVAEACGTLYLAEPAPGVRGRLIARFAPNTRIRVRSLEDLRKMAEKSVDLAVMNSVAQYMTPAELDSAFAVIRRLLKPGGRLIVGDILRPEVGMIRDVDRAVTLRADPRLSARRADRAGLHRAVGLPAIARARRPAALRRSRNDRQTRGEPDLPPRAPISISGTIHGG